LRVNVSRIMNSRSPAGDDLPALKGADHGWKTAAYSDAQEETALAAELG